jgi:hypothetical protein
MEEKQSPTRLGELLQKQTYSASNSQTALTTTNKPTFVTEITTMYGSFVQLSNKFSYANKNVFVQDAMACFRRDSPTFVRIDLTYGKGSSANWIYNILQGMFVFLGVTNDKFSKEQIYNLSCNIYANYKTLKVVEFLLFVTKFEAGKYGRFYGDTSYALVVGDALNQFMVEREHYYADIERERAEKKREESKKGAITFEEYKRMKEAKGESVSDTLKEMYENG